MTYSSASDPRSHEALSIPMGGQSDQADYAIDQHDSASPDHRTFTLLQTKLTIPRMPVSGAVVMRDRLIDRIVSETSPKVVLVRAPAGFGKTTIVLQAIARLPGGHGVAWLSLDHRDNDPIRFSAYVIGALQRVIPELGRASHVGIADAPAAQFDDVLNELAISKRHTILVLDDLHQIENPVIHETVGYLADFAPDNLRLIVTSREEPPLPLARNRAYGDLVEIRAEDLSMTIEETGQMLSAGFGEQLPNAIAADAHARTEGWAFALQNLIALMRGVTSARRAEVLADFIGSHRDVADFLIDEILRRQTVDRRDFLLRTSILNRLSGGLCDALTGRSDGHATLRILQQAGIPLFELDANRRWYRYHHLLSELLSEQLEIEIGAAGVAALHQQASAYFRANGLLEDATEHAIAAGDWDAAVGLIHEVGYDPIGQRRIQTFRRWLESLPVDRLQADPMLLYWYGRSLYTMSEPNPARGFLERAERAWLAAGNDEHIGDVRMARAWCAIFQGDYDEALPLSVESVELNRTRSDWSRTGSIYTHGVALTRAGRAREALETFDSLGDDHPHLGLVPVERAHALMLNGRFQEALDQFRVGLLFDNPTKLLQRAQIWNAMIHMAWNDLDRAADHLERAEELAAMLESQSFVPFMEIAKAQWLTSNGRQHDALSELERGLRRAREAGAAAAVRAVCAARAGIWIELGRLSDAADWRSETRLADDTLADYTYFESHLVNARLSFELEDSGTAIAQLDKLRSLAERDGRVVDAGRILVLSASVHEHSARRDLAEADLARALCLLEPSGHLRCYLDDGFSLLGPLRSLAVSGNRLDYLNRIIQAIRPPESTSTSQPGLVEPLSPRELEVLRLVSIGLSNRDISDQLFISVPTVKRHLSTIFEKLAVGSRTQAVNLARSLQLI